MRYKSIIKAPRWAKTADFIKNAAWMHDLECKVDVTKHLIRETVRFEVEGNPGDAEKFRKTLEEAVENYNRE